MVNNYIFTLLWKASVDIFTPWASVEKLLNSVCWHWKASIDMFIWWTISALSTWILHDDVSWLRVLKKSLYHEEQRESNPKVVMILTTIGQLCFYLLTSKRSLLPPQKRAAATQCQEKEKQDNARNFCWIIAHFHTKLLFIMHSIAHAAWEDSDKKKYAQIVKPTYSADQKFISWRFLCGAINLYIFKLGAFFDLATGMNSS